MNGLKFMRQYKGMTQMALAKAIGVDRKLVFHWEAGTKPIPEDKKPSLARVFNAMPVKYFSEEITPDKGKEVLQHLQDRDRFYLVQGVRWCEPVEVLHMNGDGYAQVRTMSNRSSIVSIDKLVKNPKLTGRVLGEGLFEMVR